MDDKLHDHRKARAARKAAMGVWLLAGSWCADNLTDGFVPESVLPRWGTRADAKRLVQVGLWVEDSQNGEAGWRYHEWAERQPTREDVEAERADARERMAELRAKRRANRRNGSEVVRANTSRSSDDVRSAPTRPDPTVVPNGTTDEPRKRASRLGDDWNPTAEDLAWAAEKCPGVNHLRETEKFRNYWQAKAGQQATKLDWSKTWRNWLLQASERLPQRKQAARVPGQPIYLGD